MRKLISPALICLALLCPITFALAAETTPLPVYSGGKVVMELNVTEQDFLPVIRQMITTFPKAMLDAILAESEKDGPSEMSDTEAEMLSSLFDDETLADLQEALADLRSVSVMAYTLPKTAKVEEIPDFYLQKLGLSKGWTPTMRLEGPKGMVRVYAKPDLEGIFGFAVQPGSVGVFRTEGRVDLATIGRVMTKWIPMVIGMRSETTIEGATVEIPEETPPDSEDALDCEPD